MLEIKTLSAMEKVFPDREPTLYESEGSAFRNEIFHFGFTVEYETEDDAVVSGCRLVFGGPLAPNVRCFRVESVPAGRAAYKGNSDDYYISHEPGMYPDVLRPIGDRPEYFMPNSRTGYIAELSGRLPAGRNEITVSLVGAAGETLASGKYTLDVIDEDLPDSGLIVTQWIHYDCIAKAHGVPVFSDAFYKVCEAYFRTAVKYGQTMVMVPLFTFALDTLQGGERETFQTVKVKIRDGRYEFDLSETEKFMQFALDCGFCYFEMSHLFSQWGAAAAPKIVAEENGEIKKIFGWETDSSGKEYLEFLDAFLPQLTAMLRRRGWDKITFFHLSDEPHGDALGRYGALAEFVKARIGGMPVMDALSQYDFFDRGYVDMPAVATNHCEDYFAHGKRDILAYYCCVQTGGYLSNRLLAMPGQRTRVIGFQLYETGVKGLLQWGFNFYNSLGSVFALDPYRITDGAGWVAGDPFVVYPCGEGVLPSLRLVDFADGINDYRALKLLEQKRGRGCALAVLHEAGIEGFATYPHSAARHTAVRAAINALITSRPSR